MNDREKWRERVRDIRATSTTWWWWFARNSRIFSQFSCFYPHQRSGCFKLHLIKWGIMTVSAMFTYLQSLYQSFVDCTQTTNYSWYKRHFLVSQFFQFPSKVQVLIFLFTFFQFYSVVSRDGNVHNTASSLFLRWFLYVLVVWLRLGDPFVCQNPRRAGTSHFPEQML